MAAWYLLNALGLYSLAPGTPDYVLTSPLFANVTVALPGNRTLNIVALNQAVGSPYVTAVMWNGAPVPGVTITYAELMAGGTLTFTMSATAPSGHTPPPSANVRPPPMHRAHASRSSAGSGGGGSGESGGGKPHVRGGRSEAAQTRV